MGCPGENTLYELVTGRAVPDRGAVDQHLGTCDECRRLVAELVSETSEGPIHGADTPTGDTLETRVDGPASRKHLRAVETPIDRVTPPAKVGRYLPARFLGAGGMGVVYAAFDPQLRREVALKVIRPERIAGGTERDRLLREAQAMAKLSHPNVVSIYDAGIDGEQVFVAMELVSGPTLRAWIEGPEADGVARETRVRVLLDAGRGLASGHSVGIVHRDFKPENVLLGADARPRVTDFGLARHVADEEPEGPVPDGEPTGVDGAPAPSEDHWPDLVGSTITRTGFFAGTPGYMAPEQFAGGPGDARVDQFAFCVVAWELLEGTRPFAGRFVEELIASVQAGTIIDPDPARIPPRLAAVLRRGLAPGPAARHPSMDALLEAIAEAERPPLTTAEEAALVAPQRARWLVPAVLASLVAAATVIVVVARSGGRTTAPPTVAPTAVVPAVASSPDAASTGLAVAPPLVTDAAPVAASKPPTAAVKKPTRPVRRPSKTRPSKAKPKPGHEDDLIPNPWQAP